MRLEIIVDDKGSAKIKKVEGAHGSLEKKVVAGSARMSKAVDRVRARWAKMGQMLKNVARIGKIALAGLALAAVVTGAKFEQSMANVAAISSATNVELQKLTATARGLGATTAFSASQAAEAMYSLASAGQSVNQIIETSGSVLLFAGAAATDLGSAAETLVQTLAMFSLEAAESNRVVNVFAASIASSLLNAERLREGLAAVGSTASALGLDLEGTVATLGLLNSAGQIGGIAGTRLKNVLSRLASPNAILKELLGDVAFQTDGLTASMLALKDADPGAIFKAFGRIAAPAVLVMRNLTDEMDRLKKAITGTNKAQEMFAIQMNTVASQFKIFKSQLQENMIATFFAMRDAGFNVIGGLTNLLKDLKPYIVGIVSITIEWIRSNAELLKTLAKIAGAAILLVSVIKVVQLLIGAFVLLQATVAIVAKTFVFMGRGLVLVKRGFMAVRGAIELARIALLVFVGGWPLLAIAAGAAVAAILIYLYKTNDTVQDIFEKIKRGAASLGEKILGVLYKALDTVRDVFEKIARKAAWLGKKIWEVISWPFRKIAELAEKAAGIFAKVFPEAAEYVAGLAETLGGKLGGAFEWTAEKGKEGANAAKEAAAGIAGAVGGVFDQVKDKGAGAMEAVKGAAGEVAGAVGGAFDAAKEKVSGFFEHIRTTGAGAAGAIAAPKTREQKIVETAFVNLATGRLTPEQQLAQAEKTARSISDRQITIGAETEDKRRAQLVETIHFRGAVTREALDASLEAELEMIRTIMDEEVNASDSKQEIAELEVERAQMVAEAKMEHQQAVLDHWMETHQLELAALDALGAAYDTFFNTILQKEMTGKKRREAMWASSKKAFMKNVAEQIKFWIKQQLVGLVVTRAAKDADAAKDRLSGAKIGAIKAYQAFAAIPLIGPILGAAAAVAAFAFLMAFQKGGRVPGASFGRDSVPAMLEPEEHVITRAAARSVGHEQLDYINRTGALPQTTRGGSAIYNFDFGSGDPPDVAEEIREFVEDQVVPELEDIRARRRGLVGRRNVA